MRWIVLYLLNSHSKYLFVIKSLSMFLASTLSLESTLVVQQSGPRLEHAQSILQESVNSMFSITFA
jgi:CHASE3 domain sensor protein